MIRRKPANPLAQRGALEAGQHAQHAAPMPANAAAAIDHLIDGVLRSWGIRQPGIHHAKARRSNVRGCSGEAPPTGSAIGPGVCPMGKKRERRRASASLALTGNVS